MRIEETVVRDGAPRRTKFQVNPAFVDRGVSALTRLIEDHDGHRYAIRRVFTGKGKGNGYDNHRWPQDGFSFELVQDYQGRRQPTRRVVVTSDQGKAGASLVRGKPRLLWSHGLKGEEAAARALQALQAEHVVPPGLTERELPQHLQP